MSYGMSIAPDTPLAGNYTLNGMALGLIAGLTFFFLTRHHEKMAEQATISSNRWIFSLILGHVTFCFTVALNPLAGEAARFFGDLGPTFISATLLAFVLGPVTYWLVSVNDITLECSAEDNADTARLKTTLRQGVLFACACITAVPMLISVNQQLVTGKHIKSHMLIADTEQSLSTLHKLRTTALGTQDQTEEQGLQELAAIENAIQLHNQKVRHFAGHGHLATAQAARIPGNHNLVELQQRAFELARTGLLAQSANRKAAYQNEFRILHAELMTESEAAASLLKGIIATHRDRHITQGNFKLMVGPIVILALAIGLFWPLLRLVYAQQLVLDRKHQMAEAANKSKSQFIATMSHEIRTPLNGIMGMLEVLKGSGLNKEQKGQTTIALNSADSLLAILNDILDYSKYERGDLELESIPFSPRELVSNTTSLLEAQICEKTLELTTSISESVPESLLGDPTRINQILLNLVGNAVKFTNKGSIHINVNHYFDTNQFPTLKVSIIDTGIGIPAQMQKRIFDKFEQADASTTRQFGGTGLGLAICRELVIAMGGKIGMQSTEGQGSTFWFSIPAPHTVNVLKPKVKEAQDQAENAKFPLRILAAEDNLVNQQVLAAFLAAEDHELTCVNDGREAVNAVKEKPFDVILMDIQMPNLDGIEATQEIRALPSPENKVHIIALTADAALDNAQKFSEIGMNDCLTKPLTQEKLLSTLDAVSARLTHPAELSKIRA